ncbi:flavin reductase (DIM6/NTAB) family NADH-FMN oxidoreductase RutF [Streptomyces sp. 3211.6]|uniref:flavin reductase family protein n=1 Tax=Streptomyces TaxID=1883 RepID=UPI0009A4760C|nr:MULTISPECIES: flavin reductase family protein [Streptomyces]RKT06662.1 flavin reductase (DIM6/NTAB) family NADH-FMN oxidoreductase RutF [Streptomyces sp. 3211.6]RPF45801.1 flavin reductase (DIM6/NTAB) family NADH-FMN oxidoreductase RutF [Streptomyces sp. Ag109_G2-6]
MSVRQREQGLERGREQERSRDAGRDASWDAGREAAPGRGRERRGSGEAGPADPVARFTEAMARLVSGVAVVSARRADGSPCGLLVSSVSSYSVAPPSVMLALSRDSRTYRAMEARVGTPFGVHLLGSADEALARVFAGRGEDKFAGVAWDWDEGRPRIAGVPVYLGCRAAAVFPHGDHVVLLGEVADCTVRDATPLVHYRRRLDWHLA